MKKSSAGKKQKKRVFVGLSGGVDSSVAALLLQKEGYDVTGIFLRSYNLDGCAERDAEDARRVAAHLRIPFYVFDFEEEYKREVVNYMVEGYRRGITPNPDVMCNKEIKFGAFLKKALEMGADYIATGHYVRIKNYELGIKGENKPLIHHSLFTARDTNKDQSYFLWTLTQAQLAHCLFPIGDYVKSEVREMARKAGLPTAEKKDSQGICFLGKVTLAEFLKQHIPEQAGPVVTPTGEEIGEHRGAHFYTIGQRHLGIKNYELGMRGGSETRPRYVAAKDMFANTITVVEGEDDPLLFRKEIELTNVNFINPYYFYLSKVRSDTPEKTKAWLSFRRQPEREYRILPVLARVRYRQPLMKARIVNNESWMKHSYLIHNLKFLILKFDQPVKFVAPGQSAVFYSAEGEMLGGGVIK